MAGQPAYHVNVFKNERLYGQAGYPPPPPKRVTLPTRGPPPPCKQALNDQLSVGLLHVAQLGTSAAPVSQRAGFKSRQA